MTGIDILKEVYALLDMDASKITPAQRATATSAVSRIAQELGGVNPVTGLHQNLGLAQEKLSAMVYGVAMLICAARGDGERAAYFTALYNGKRGKALSNSCCRRDTLPASFS